MNQIESRLFGKVLKFNWCCCGNRFDFRNQQLSLRKLFLTKNFPQPLKHTEKYFHNQTWWQTPRFTRNKKFSMSRHSIFLLATVHGASILFSAGFVCVSAISMDWREFPRKNSRNEKLRTFFCQWMWELMLFSARNFENTQGEILTSQSDFSREIVKNVPSLLCRWNSVINDNADKRDFPF